MSYPAGPCLDEIHSQHYNATFRNSITSNVKFQYITENTLQFGSVVCWISRETGEMWKLSIFLSAFCTLLSAQSVDPIKICRTITAPVWVNAVGGTIPEGALNGGQDSGENLIVCRAHHRDAIIPGTFSASLGVCYVA
ncbi:CLUMA_CG013684, isoform A [Clunio marinus]|uniref:CLUMA_CG013684, isoform A n=1 Tax=Clunio marinus TaxID=568069 RepID=A0A1J1IKX1_9DIPT|nr:CLUMA_CG013684, isoform A [Clunio marinus]